MSLVENLCRDYVDFKVDIPYWELPDEGVVALWGPSGSGKTSVIRLLTGLEPCPKLRWQFGDIDLAETSVRHRGLGVVFQNYGLFPHLTAEENLLFAAKARRLSREQVLKQLDDIKSVFNLGNCWDRKAQNLSGGEKQRVALGRALIGRPRMLLLDEPFSALDSHLRKESRIVVLQAVRKYKIPTLLITHDPVDVEALAERVDEISNGKITRSTSARDFLNQIKTT